MKLLSCFRITPTALLSFVRCGVIIIAIVTASVTGLIFQAGAAPKGIGVIDGDTLEIDGRIVHIFGIDAPELGQRCHRGKKLRPCGIEAAFALKKHLDLVIQPLKCTPQKSDERDYRGIPSYVCYQASLDIAEAQLRGGHAVAAPKTFPNYLEAEHEAKIAGIGVWRGSFVLPWKWRQGERLPGSGADAEEVCAVKGVRAAAGRQVFHVPTDSSFKNISVDVSRGGRCFGSVGEALKAGWTRP